MAEVSYEVRVMRKDEIPKALDAWKETGYQEGTRCLYTWYEVDPQAFHVAVTDSGEVLGACCAVRHHDDLAFVGMYVVRKNYRGLGIGYKIWKAAMDHIGNRNAALNAVPGKLELYRDKGGFPIVEDKWMSVASESKEDVDPGLLSDTVPSGVVVKPLQEQDLPLALEYDFKLTGYNREVAVRASCKEPDSASCLALQNGKCVGYGTIKLSVQNSAQLGPLYAEDAQIAEALLKKLLESKPKDAKGFTMFTFSCNQPSKALMRKLGIPEGQECERCYTKHLIDIDTSKVFGQFDLNFTPL